METKIKIDEHFPHLEIAEAVLIHCNIVNNDYQQDLKVLNKFGLNKSSGQLLDINSELLYIELWFTDLNSKPLEIEDKINIILVINKKNKAYKL